VTSVGGTTYSYDNNGNVAAIGSLDYTWDWRNRLSSAERSSGGTTSYGYDHAGQRVFQATGSATTSYANKYYNVDSSSLTATTTKHIFSPDGTLLATVVGASTTASTTYLHPDHLGGTLIKTSTLWRVPQVGQAYHCVSRQWSRRNRPSISFYIIYIPILYSYLVAEGFRIGA
jgi:hypothetical protein